MSTDYRSEIEAALGRLSSDEQRRVLEYVRSLNCGERAGRDIVARFAGAIPASDLQLMQAAIDSECEQVDRNEW